MLARKNAGDVTEEDLKGAKVELKRIADQVTEIAEKANGELKKTGDLATETKAKVDELLTEKTKLDARVLEIEQKLARRGAANDDGSQFETVGATVIKSDRLKEFVANKTRGTISIEVKSAQMKAMFSADVSQGTPGVINPMQLPGILARLRQRLFIRDLISSGRTGAPAVAYVRQTGFTNNAAVVSEGVRKPESAIAFEAKLAQVATIAHIFKAAKQLLDDFDGLQSTIDDEMRYGLAYAEEQQILYGDGTGINLHGIVPQASAFAPAFQAEFHNRIDDLRLAILQSELAMLPATGIVLHPTDWAHIELTKTQDGAYVFANPLALAGPVMWGKPVVPTMAIAEGDFLTGAFQGGAQVFDREDANVVIATQNEDDFVKNMITVRAEERLALAVKRPEAFISGEFTAVS